jgi:hypothetical protein
MTHSITLLVLVHQNIYNSITVAVSCASTKVGFVIVHNKNLKRYSWILGQTAFSNFFIFNLEYMFLLSQSSDFPTFSATIFALKYACFFNCFSHTYIKLGKLQKTRHMTFRGFRARTIRDFFCCCVFFEFSVLVSPHWDCT